MNDQYHAWSKEQATEIALPLLTCEAVLSEVYFLLDGIPNARRSLMKLYRKHGRQVIPVMPAKVR